MKSLLQTKLEKEIYRHVKNCPGDTCDCEIEVQGYNNEDVLSAAFDLVRRGVLKGAFPPNANMRDGIDWGYLVIRAVR